MATQITHILNGFLDRYISPLDRGFAYGDGVFRTMKVVNGSPQHWPQHYQKLVADCAAIGIVCPSAELLMDDIQRLFIADESHAQSTQLIEPRIAVAKITITRGEGERGYALPAVTMPTRLVSRAQFPSYAETNFTEGVNLKVCDIKLPHQPKLAGIKHLNRLENVLARMEWQNDGASLPLFDGILLNTQHEVVECTMSNLFARFDETLITPDLTNCGVAGITRQQIISHAAVLKLNVVIENLPLDKLLQADEVVICNSLYSAFQVRSILHADTTTLWQPQTLAAAIRQTLSPK